jgi:hypothetical protein
MYTNNPKQDTINIKDFTKRTVLQLVYTMIRILTTILDKDFFKFNNKIYQQKGLPMEAPLSLILSEI